MGVRRRCRDLREQWGNGKIESAEGVVTFGNNGMERGELRKENGELRLGINEITR